MAGTSQGAGVARGRDPVKLGILILGLALSLLVPTWWEVWHVGNRSGWWACGWAECEVQR